MTDAIPLQAARNEVDVSDPMTTPGEPGATRYMCPLCDWFYDEPPLDYGEIELPPGVGLEGLHDAVDETLMRRIAVVEVALRGHFMEHMAALILDGRRCVMAATFAEEGTAYLGVITDATPIHGEDLCDDCLDCLHCHGDEECRRRGRHAWVVYKNNCAAFLKNHPGAVVLRDLESRGGA